MTDERRKQIKRLVRNYMRPGRGGCLSSRGVDELMERANNLLDCHGVEALFCGGTKPVLLYVNTGETYAETLLWDGVDRCSRLGSWGAWLEWRETPRGGNYRFN